MLSGQVPIFMLKPHKYVTGNIIILYKIPYGKGPLFIHEIRLKMRGSFVIMNMNEILTIQTEGTHATDRRR